jgi:cell division protein FtsL
MYVDRNDLLFVILTVGILVLLYAASRVNEEYCKLTAKLREAEDREFELKLQIEKLTLRLRTVNREGER